MRAQHPCLAVCALALAIIQVGVTPAAAHFGDVAFPIYELASSDLPDLHDGTLDEWEDIVPGPSMDHRDFFASAALEDVLDQSSLAFRVFLAWNNATQRLYGAVERVDDVYFNRGQPDEGSTSFLYQSDCIEFLVDGDHGGERFFPSGNFQGKNLYAGEDKLIMNVAAQRWALTAEPIDLRVQGGSNVGLLFYPDGAWFARPPYADAGGFVLPGEPVLSGTEFMLTPWDALIVDGEAESRPSALVAERYIGIDVFVWDWDGPRDSDLDAFVLLGTANGQSAAGFKDGVLVPCGVGDCSRGAHPSAVVPSSWGRIKAAVRAP